MTKIQFANILSNELKLQKNLEHRLQKQVKPKGQHQKKQHACYLTTHLVKQIQQVPQ